MRRTFRLTLLLAFFLCSSVVPLTAQSVVQYSSNAQIVVPADTFSVRGYGTVEAWFMLSTSTFQRDIINVPATGFAFNVGQENSLVVTTGSGGGTGVVSYATGTWHHIAATFTPTAYTLYFDGSAVKQGPLIGPVTMFDAGQTIYIGGNGAWFYGNLDDIRIWNVARSAYEIQSSMKQDLTGTEPGLIAYYPINELGGTTVNDLTGHGLHGSIVGGAGFLPGIGPRDGSRVFSTPATDITTTSAVLHGNAEPDSGTVKIFVEYGPTAALGSSSPTTEFASSDTVVTMQFTWTGLTPSTTYHYRTAAVFGTDTVRSVILSFPTLAVPPTIPASSIVFENVQGKELTLRWTNGNGAERIVLVREGEAVSYDPPEGMFINSWWNQFAYAEQIAPGTVLAYRGTDTMITMYELSPLTTYHFSILEFNGGQDGVPITFLRPGTTAQQQTIALMFSDSIPDLPGRYDSHNDVMDMDGDGDLDLLLGGGSSDGDSVFIHRNNGDGSFTTVRPGLPILRNGSVKWADIDRDGDMDIAAVGEDWEFSQSFAVILRNDGGSYTNLGVTLTALTNAEITWADMDNDGDPDLCYTGTDYATDEEMIAVYRNDNGTAFTAVTSGISALAKGSMAWSDFDKDGDLDLAIGGLFDLGNESAAKIYRNDGGFTFTDIAAPLAASGRGKIVWADMDNDGDQDLVMFASSGGTIYRNTGGTFTDIGVSLHSDLGGYYDARRWVVAGDFNDDGRTDLFLSGENDDEDIRSILYRNDGGDSFTPFLASATGLREPYSGQWYPADWNGDGSLDLMVEFDGGSTSAYIFENAFGAGNTAPVPPALHSVITVGDSTVLRWGRGTDMQTPAAGLTYSLRIGTTRNGTQILDPLAVLTTGTRRSITAGNAGSDTSWFINDLPDGIYYWSVQTVDNAYLGSSFSPVDSFAVGVPLPVELTSFTAVPNSRGVELRWNTANELNNAGFEIERKGSTHRSKDSAGQWIRIGFVEGHGTSNAPQQYSFIDGAGRGTVLYRLKQVDRDGNFTYSPSVEVNSAVPSVFALEQNYPNPFNPSTTIAYQIPAVGRVKMSVFDALGREVAVLVNDVKEPGSYAAQFDGMQHASGMYFVQLHSGGMTAVRKMLLVK
ncbi:MAG: VCBS repeat-containing protein [Bacteroidetes bacterium]|nr:VCBS repeat-containing protein [Bacteroidota bacterium]